MDQKQALDILKLGHNVFLTGAAGSGKTFLLNQYIEYLKVNDVIIGITASTGVAATHMNGKTIHSWAHIGIKDELLPIDLNNIYKRSDYRTQILEARVLIIDEVSMLHHFRLDMVNQVLQKVHKNNMPFGGIQVVLCGDLFQLPPVSRGGQLTRFVNDSEVWELMDIKICYLGEQYRQEDDDFLKLLNEMRQNKVSNDSLLKLHARINKDIDADIVPTKLYTHNMDVDALNSAELDKINTEDHQYLMTSKGEKHLRKSLSASCLAPEELHIKEGAVVMFVQNNFVKGYVNGTLGKVIGFSKEGKFPIVKTFDKKVITAKPGSWRIEEGTEVLAEISQVPLRLAWAITIHKSQGMTLDAAQIDLSKAFVEGMGYVALSRVRSLGGIKLLGINNKALMVSSRIIEIDFFLKESSMKAENDLKQIKPKKLHELQKFYLSCITD